MEKKQSADRAIRRSFERAASGYDNAAVVQAHIADNLLERLDFLKMVPKRVLDLGCGTGTMLSRLAKRYPKAALVGVDITLTMLALQRKQWFKKKRLVCGDISALPFADNSFDMIISNQVIHWAYPLKPLFAEVARVLQPGGVFLFSTLGPDTFKELRLAFTGIDDYAHANDFLDMHDVGDELLAAGFSEPVMDMEQLTVSYSSVKVLCRELKAQGVNHIHQQRRAGLMGKTAWRKFEQAYLALADQQSRLPLCYEVVYGQAWGATHDRRRNEVSIPISQIGKI